MGMPARSAKGRLGRPVEFGAKAQVVDNDNGIVLDHTVEQRNLADSPQLPRRRSGSRSGLDAHRARSPPTAAMAKPKSIGNSSTSA